jgi:PAS domain S-box-containing protein
MAFARVYPEYIAKAEKKGRTKTEVDEIIRWLTGLTAFADEPTLQRARIAEAFGYILKPFEERELNVNIEMALYKHQMENKLRVSEERYNLAIQGANDGLWDWDLKAGSVFYSARWKEMLGFGNEEIGNSSVEWFQLIHPEDDERFKLNLSNHLAQLTSHFQIEYRINTKRDGYRWMLTPSNRALDVFRRCAFARVG